MKKVSAWVIAALTAFTMVGVLVLPASAASSNITPQHQSVQHGALATWTATYQNNAGTTGSARWRYQSGGSYTSWPTSGSVTYSKSLERRFYPCTQTTYQQRLQTRVNNQVTSSATATTTVQGGSPC